MNDVRDIYHCQKNTCPAFRKQVLENVFKGMLNSEYLLQSTLT